MVTPSATAASISTAPPPLASMQFSTLLQQGIDVCQELAGDFWTDYNEHDPGVTILEQLSYAITDLGYRVNYPVADILAEVPAVGKPGETALFPGDSILCRDPITMLDFRKLVCDRAKLRHLANFKNMWLAPVANAAGLYDALIETWSGGDDPNVASQVTAILQSQRNLGDDFASVKVMPTFGIQIEATLSIASTASPNTVLAGVLCQLQNALVPFVHFTSVDQLMQQGVPPDQIFLGPKLTQGALADDQFSALPASISVLELATAIMSVAGVESVIELSVNGLQSGSVAIPAGSVARLQPSIFVPQSSWPIKLMLSGKPAATDAARVGALITQQITATATSDSYAPQSSQSAAYGNPPPGQFKDISQYFSLQRQFPLTYGVGAYGVGLRQTQSRATVAERNLRVSQAKQLKAFLLFFEQILADGFSQLANAARLFSLERELDRSYFWQPLVPLGPDVLQNCTWQKPVNPGAAPPYLIEWEILRPAHAPPPPPAEDRRYTVQVSADGPAPLRILRSGEYPTRSEAAVAQQNLLEWGQDASRYQVRALPNGQVCLLLADSEGKAIGFGIERYATRQDGELEVPRLAGYMRKLAHDPGLRAKHVSIVSSGTLGLQLIDDQGRILLVASDLARAEQDQRIALWLQLGIHSKYYRIAPASGASFRVFLCNRDNLPVGTGAEYFASVADAETAVAQLVALIQSLCCNAVAQARHLLRLPKPDPKPDSVDAIARYATGMDLLVRQFDPYVRRRNGFLDHLLARFNESFADAELIAFDPRHDIHRKQCELDLIASKIEFLRHYPQDRAVQGDRDYLVALGAGRSKGFNYTTAAPEQSGLEQRLKLLLGFHWAGANRPAATPSAEWAYLAIDAPNTGVTIGHGLATPGTFVFSSRDPAIFQGLLLDGATSANYSIATNQADGSVSVQFKWPDGSPPSEVYRASTRGAALEAIDAISAHLRAFSLNPESVHAYEELFVVEHLLLRPLQDAAAATVPPRFYDYRISVILPGWAARFQHPGFRDLTERLVAENCPAHLAAECHWLDRGAMTRFKQLYEQWRAQRHSEPIDRGRLQSAAFALAEFIHKLEPEIVT